MLNLRVPFFYAKRGHWSMICSVFGLLPLQLEHTSPLTGSPSTSMTCPKAGSGEKTGAQIMIPSTVLRNCYRAFSGKMCVFICRGRRKM